MHLTGPIFDTLLPQASSRFSLETEFWGCGIHVCYIVYIYDKGVGSYLYKDSMLI